MKIALVVIWFGKFPEWFPLWLRSASCNPKFDFYIVSDQEWKCDYKNIHIKYMNLDTFRELASKEVGFKVCLKTPYKLCDYKILWRIAIEDEMKNGNYEYWGYFDIDVIYGNLGKFLTDDFIRKYEKLFDTGNFSLLRNTEKTNNLYKRSEEKENHAYPYKKAFKNNWACYFDEYLGMSILGYLYMNAFRDQKTENYVQDFPWQHLNFTSYITKEDFIFKWEEGNLYRYLVDENGVIKKDESGKPFIKEYMLGHIQKRNMKISDSLKAKFDSLDTIKSFWIIPNEFTEDEPTGVLYTEDDKVAYAALIRKKDKERQIRNLKRNGLLSYIPHRIRTKKILKYIREEKGFY